LHLMTEEATKKREGENVLPDAKRAKVVESEESPISLNLLNEFKSPTPLSSAKFSPNGNFLACASEKIIVIYEADSLNPCCTLVGHLLGINDVAWSSDSRYLASASDDKNICIWDVQSGELLKTLRGHTNYVFLCEIQ